PPFAAMLVGSYPQPDWLVEFTGAVPPVRFRLEGDALAEGGRKARSLAIADQTDAGLAGVTDGEQDRVSYQEYFLRRMDGLRYKDGSPIAKVVGPLALPAPIAVEALAPMRALTDLPIKLSVVGPFTLSNRMNDGYYHDRDKLGAALADAV